MAHHHKSKEERVAIAIKMKRGGLSKSKVVKAEHELEHAENNIAKAHTGKQLMKAEHEVEKVEKILDSSAKRVPAIAYDIKAKKKVEILNPTAVMFNKKRGIWALTGKSAVTGNKVFRIVGKHKPIGY